jgi:hypothetical protein
MKPFNEGKRDFKKGQISNPYNPDTQRNREWERGFNSEYFRNLDQVIKRETKDLKRGGGRISEKEGRN